MNAQERSLDHVFRFGGEPLLRRDLPEIVDMYSPFIIGLSTNATPRPDHGAAAGRGVCFVNIGPTGRGRLSRGQRCGDRGGR